MLAATELREAMARVLDGVGDNTVPLPIRQVDSFRAAARRLMEEEQIDVKDRCLLVLDLHAVAEEAILSSWCQRAIFEEWREMTDPDAPPLPPLTERQAAGLLRRAGYCACPTCHRNLLSDMELERYERLQARTEYEAAVRRDAVKKGR